MTGLLISGRRSLRNMRQDLPAADHPPPLLVRRNDSQPLRRFCHAAGEDHDIAMLTLLILPTRQPDHLNFVISDVA